MLFLCGPNSIQHIFAHPPDLCYTKIADSGGNAPAAGTGGRTVGKSVTEVVAALIWDRSHFLICQRPAHKARGLLWEFVGGKVEPGETKEEALVRECREELAVTVRVGGVYMEVLHEYPDLTVRLTLFHASIREGTIQKLEHNDIRWITADELGQYDFCPADESILQSLRKDARTLEIGCCAAYCKTCREFGGTCPGCKTGYAGGARDLGKARCAIKRCCLGRRLVSCADCPDCEACPALLAFHSHAGYKYGKYRQSFHFIRRHGYDAFLRVAAGWTNAYGKL